MTRTLRVAVIAFGLLALSSAPAAAALVADPAAADGAAGSLRERVGAAVANETIQLPPGTYRLTQGQLDIGKGLTLAGQGQRADQVVITAEGRSRVLSVTPPLAGTVNLRRLQVSGGRVADGTGGGGVLKQGAGALNLEEVTLSGNSASASPGGGGLAAATGDVTITRSAVVNNSATVSTANAGGGGILHTGNNALVLVNVSLSGNQVTGPANAGGSALLNNAGTLSLDSVTIAYNSTSPGGLGALRSTAGIARLGHTMVEHNGTACVGTFTSDDFNIDGDNSCGLNRPNDKPGIVAEVEQLADNGGPTPTLRLPPGSLAINAGGTVCPSQDQRNAVRPAENETSCDVGAVEFEGFANVEVPPCSRSGQLPFSIFSPPETSVEALDFLIDGGDPFSPLQVLISRGPSSATGTINIPEGRRQLEYWSDSFPTGTARGVQLKHATPLVVVDRTDPRVAVANPNPFRVFVIRRRTSVQVSASDSISGLVVDPSGQRGLDTSRRGSKTFAPEAVDLCTNQATAPFSYRVLAPGLGVRAVLESVRGRVLTLAAGGGGAARTSQKGRRFSPLREPREVAIRSLVDTRRGTVRLTSSRNSATAIQDGQFSGGVFQVLQSRRRSAKGLTELRLKGSSFRRCRGATGSRAFAAAGRRRVIRRLRGRGSGRFRTRGRYSAATVRGTTWTVEDRCDGTLTKVTRGRVAVRDFRRRKTVIVRAGKRYLARAPG